MHSLAFPFELKSTTEASSGVFEGLASTYGNIDLGGDIVVPGAFTKTLQERGSSVVLLSQHDATKSIGLGEVSDSAEGLRIRGKLEMGLVDAQQEFIRLRSGLVKGLSIGYRVYPGGAEMKDGVRLLKSIELHECSLCTFPMNPAARVASVKGSVSSIRDFERFLRDSGYSKSEASRLAAHGWRGLADSDQDDQDDQADDDEALAAFFNQNTVPERKAPGLSVITADGRRIRLG